MNWVLSVWYNSLNSGSGGDLYVQHYVGIGTTGPSEKLEVNGGIKLDPINIGHGGSCAWREGTIAYGIDGNFYMCEGAAPLPGVWQYINWS